MIKTSDIASFLQEQLNNLSEVKFRITADVQLYNNKWLKWGGKDFYPALLRVITDLPPVGSFGAYTAIYRLEAQGDKDNRESIEDTFISLASELNGLRVDIKSTGGMFALGKPLFSDFTEKSDGSGKNIFKATLDISLTVIVAGILGSETKIYIDDIEIPFAELLFDNSKGVVANHPSNTGLSYPLLKGESFEVSLPLVDNTKTREIAQRVFDDRINVKHKVKYQIDNELFWEKDCFLRGGTIRAVNDTTALSLVARFEQALPRSNIKIRVAGEGAYKSIPVLSFGYSMTATNNTIVKDGYTSTTGQLVNEPINTGFTFDIVFLISEIIERLPELRHDVLDNFTGRLYQIRYDINREYTVTLQAGGINIEEASATLRCTFVEADTYD